MSVRQVEQAIKSTHKGFGPSRSTIHHYIVNLGLMGLSPLKPGPEGAAFGCYMHINQIHALGGDNMRTNLIPVIAEGMDISVPTATELTWWLCWDIAINMKDDEIYFAEEWGVQWMAYNNLELQFNSWEKTLLDFGLLERDKSGKHYIPWAQLRNTLNFDKTWLSLDGSSVIRGGYPAAYYYDPCLQQLGKLTSKTSQTITIITGSSS